jgi:diguanylate cyclase (GGDEF)-like protein
MMLANAFYAAAYTFEINSPSLAIAVERIKIEYIGVTFVPVFWFLLARVFVNEARPMSIGRLVPLSIIPVATIILMWTNDAHGLIYRSLRLHNPDSPLTVLTSNGMRGPWFWVNTGYLYLLMLYGTVTIIARLSRASGKFRGQIVTIATAVILPWIGHLLLILDLEPNGLDLTPFLTTVSGVLLAYSIIRFSFLDLAPIAREVVLDAIRDGVIVLDRKGRFVDANKAAKAVFAPLGEAMPGSDSAALLEPFGISPGDEPRSFSLDRGGKTRHYEATSVEINDGRGEAHGTAIIIHETTETVELLARLEKLVATDELTQVDNRRRFFELAERELGRARRRGEPISFAMLDLDHFKLVNDDFGHAAGDAALVAVCGACRAVLRSADVLCRYGGEEFVIILPDAAPEAALEIIERVRGNIEATAIPFGGGKFSITASIGVAGSAGPPYLELEDYLRHSDEALYQAKTEGRNRVLAHGDLVHRGMRKRVL